VFYRNSVTLWRFLHAKKQTSRVTWWRLLDYGKTLKSYHVVVTSVLQQNKSRVSRGDNFFTT